MKAGKIRICSKLVTESHKTNKTNHARRKSDVYSMYTRVQIRIVVRVRSLACESIDDDITSRVPVRAQETRYSTNIFSFNFFFLQTQISRNGWKTGEKMCEIRRNTTIHDDNAYRCVPTIHVLWYWRRPQ